MQRSVKNTAVWGGADKILTHTAQLYLSSLLHFPLRTVSIHLRTISHKHDKKNIHGSAYRLFSAEEAIETLDW